MAVRFTNSPNIRDNAGNQQMKRYSHQPIQIDHNGIRAAIKENGKIVLSGPARAVEGSKDEFEYDEIEIPASLVFKLAGLLKATRSISFVPVTTNIPHNESSDE